MNQISNNKWWAVVVFLLIIVNIATLTAFWVTKEKAAHSGELPPVPTKGGASAYLIKELAFDSVQQQAYQQLIKQHQETVRGLKPKIKEMKEAYFSLLSDTTITEDKIKAAAEKVNAVEQELDIATFHHFQEVRKLCNAEQQKKFDSVIVQAVRMMAPPQMPPHHGGFGHPNDGPPRDGNPPPPGEGPPPGGDGQEPPPPRE